MPNVLSITFLFLACLSCNRKSLDISEAQADGTALPESSSGTQNRTADDAKDGVLFTAADGRIWSARSDGTKFSFASGQYELGSLFDAHSSARLLAGDYDGDGRKDVAVLSPDDASVWLGRFDGARFDFARNPQSAAIGADMDAQSTARWFAGDFTGDGKDDLLVIAGGQWSIGESDGRAFSFRRVFQHAVWAAFFERTSRARMIAGDFTGDGKCDVLFAWPDDGSWRVIASTGETFEVRSFNQTLHWTPVMGADTEARLFVGNFAGDAKEDVLFTWPEDGSWWLGVSDGATFSFSVYHRSTELAAIVPRTSAAQFFVGDLDGNSYSDIGLYWPATSEWRVGLSNGLGFRFSVFAVTEQWGTVINPASARFLY